MLGLKGSLGKIQSEIPVAEFTLLPLYLLQWKFTYPSFPEHFQQMKTQ